MKIEVTPREDHQVTMLVEVDAEQMEKSRRKAARKIAEKAKIPGFRPGKAPYDVVRRYFGDGAIFEEAMELLVDEIYPAALKESSIEPGAMGSLENVEGDQTPKLTFKVPLSPSVELGDYKTVRLPYEWQAPGEDKLTEAIDNMRRMYAKTETVERECQEGDYVSLDVLGKEKKKDGEILVERNGFATVIRKEGKEGEFPFQGLAAELIGLKPGESKTVTHKYEKDYSDEKLAGKNVSFELTVKTVRGVNMPELDDEFAKRTGLGENMDDLRKHMQENLEQEARSEYDDGYYTQVLDLVKANAVIKYAPQTLEHETEHVMEDLKHRVSHQGMEFEAYLKMKEMTEEQFLEAEAKPVAVKRLERSLLMDELTKNEKIELQPDEVQIEFQKRWASLSMYDQEFAKLTKNGTRASDELVNAVAMDAAQTLVVRRTLERMKAIATGQAEAEPAAEAAAEEALVVDATPAAVEDKPKKKKASKKTE